MKNSHKTARMRSMTRSFTICSFSCDASHTFFKFGTSLLVSGCLILLCASSISDGFILDESTTIPTGQANGSVTLSGITTAPYADEGDLNCAVADEYFHVCSDIDHAKAVCRLFCNLCSLVDGSWAEWSPWSSCDVTCDDGQLTRTRTCTNPAPANLGSNCTGADNEYKACSFDACPVHGGWSPWGSWGTCSVSCGVGIQRRDRTCSNPPPQYFGDHCFRDSDDNKLCFPGHCTDGGWSTWGSWSSCSQSCGIGSKTRQRYCDNPAPSMLGSYCRGTPIQYDMCGYNDETCIAHTNVSCCVEYAYNLYDFGKLTAYRVRLCDGDGPNSCNPSSGRVEVAQLNTMEWGTVCDPWWYNNEHASNEFCLSIGYRYGSNKPRVAGPSWLPIHLNAVRCAGNETNIFNCFHNPWNSISCNHDEDVSVFCE